MQQIYTSSNGTQAGPMTLEELHARIKSGEVTTRDMAWQTGLPEWITIEKLLNPDPEPQKVGNETIYLNEPGVVIGSKNIQIGSTFFLTGNIGGVSIERFAKKKFWAVLGLILFGMMTFAGMMELFFSKGDKGPGIVMTFFFMLALTIFCYARATAKPVYSVMISASGGLQKAYSTTDKVFAEKISGAIRKAIS